MWEHFIRRLGFRNVYKGCQIIGFQFKIHIPSYRGVFVSCLSDAFTVKVDGESFKHDSISLKIGERVIPWSQIDAAFDVFWAFGTLATVIVQKPGGLMPGLHNVECRLAIRKSYVPAFDPEGVYDFAGLPRIEADMRPLSREGFTIRDPMFQIQTCSLPMILGM